MGARALAWGTWTVYTGGDVGIDLDTWVASTCATGNYINTAFCTSSESPRIKDYDTITVNAPNGRCFDVARSTLASAQTASTSLTPSGLSATAELPVPGAIAVFCSFASETVAGSTTGTWDLLMDDTSPSQSIQRYLGPSGRGMGACLNIFPSLGAGPHTVSLRHATSGAGSPVRTRDADLVILPLTSEDGQVVLNHGVNTIGSGGATTGSAAWGAVTGLGTSVTNDVKTRIFAAAVVDSESAAGSVKTASYDLTVDGVPVGGQVRRVLSGTNDLGIVTLVGLSGSLAVGPHSVEVRHSTSTGSLKTSNGTLLAFSLGDDGGGHETALGGRQTTFASPVWTTATSLTEIAWSESTIYTGDGDQILVASSFATEHGAESGGRTALHDITVDAAPVTQTGATRLSGADDRSSSGLFGLSNPLTAGTHTGFMRHAVASPEILTDDATFVMLGICCEQSPTAVKLIEFTAAGYDRLVAVEWETGAEIDSLGFYVLRSESPTGPFLRVNRAIVFSGGRASGGRYLLLDRGVENEIAYYYQLEEIGLDGEVTLYGPEAATPSAGAGGFTFNRAEFSPLRKIPPRPSPNR